MKIVDISLFAEFEKIATRHNITDGDWAKAAWGKTTNQSRISELRKILRGEKPGRTWSLDKCLKLIYGLRKLIGSNIVTNELLALLKTESDPRKRVYIMACMMEENDLPATAQFMEAIIFRNK